MSVPFEKAIDEVPERLRAALQDRYRIERSVGEGGMATVYLAEDVRHHRKVALKVLRPELAAVVGGARFVAEIETTANLQHPHILPLFDSGESDSFLYYVMPYVSGESLRARLDREKQLPISEAVRIASAVASALDHAHRHGVIHRDVKPANILLQDGQPVVADFGIALAVGTAGGGRLTETGLSLGTPFYMSPEQATGDREVGPAADVYALGCILYEMLVGEPPYTGNTAQAVLGKIITGAAPSAASFRPTIPANVDAVIRRALEKLPADRFATAQDFASALADRGFAHGSGPTESAPVRRWTPASIAAVSVGILLVTAAAAYLTPLFASPGGTASVVRSTLELPGEGTFVPNGLTISDDGRRVAVLSEVDGKRSLIERRLDRFEFRDVVDRDRSLYPSYSRDGQWISFAQRPGGLLRIPAEGGPVVTLDPEAEWDGGYWTEDGTIYYARNYQSGIWRLAPDGEPEPITRPDSLNGELGHFWPQLLPDGEHLLYTAYRTPSDQTSVDVVSVRTGERRQLAIGALSGRYVSTGHLLFAREAVLMAAPFDLNELALAGPEVPVVDDLWIGYTDGYGGFSISANGTLVYFNASEFTPPNQLVWVDREGREERISAPEGFYGTPDLSPDGSAIALALFQKTGPPDVHVLDLRRSTLSSLTRGGGSEVSPIWTPDGRDIVYLAENRVFDIHSRRADASAPARPVAVGGFDKYPYSFTPDGKALLYYLAIPEGAQLWSASRGAGSSEPERLLVEGSDLHAPTISPDGRWLAYSSTESGRREVYVVSYPNTGLRRFPVSSDGGDHPLWTKGGRELVFRQDRAVVAVQFDPISGVAGRPEILFDGPYVSARPIGVRSYDAAPDGSRFVMLKEPEGSSRRQIRMITNFFEELRRLAPN